MKTSAVAVGKRRSLLPAPKGSGGGPSLPGSRTGELPSRKNEEIATTLPTEIQPAGLKVIVKTTVGNGGNESKGNVAAGKLVGSSVVQAPVESHDGTGSKQTRFWKPSNPHQSALATRKRPTSASGVLNRGATELKQTSSVSKTPLDSGNSAKLAAVKGAAVNDRSAKTKVSRLLRGATSASASHPAADSTVQEKLPRTTARKLKVPTKYVTVGATVADSHSPEIVPTYPQAETVASAEPVISTSSMTGISPPEDDVAGAGSELPGSSSGNSVEGEFAAAVAGEYDFSESSSGAASAAGVPDVLSRVKLLDHTFDDQERLRSSSGSLGILDDADLLDTSLLSFDPCWAPSPAEAGVNDVEACCENPPGDVGVPAVGSCSEPSSSASELDPSPGVPGDELGMPPASSVRPLSLMSNSSTDVGIVADCVTVHINDSDRQNERPSSYMSTCSADTGRFSVNIARWLADDELF